MAASPFPRPWPPSSPTFGFELSGSADEAAAVRRQCGEVLGSTPQWVVWDVQLVLSELVSNVHRHTPSGCGSGTVGVAHAFVRLQVRDESVTPPALLDDAPVGGRGMKIVDALAEEWGVVLERNGKTIWADIAL